MALLIHHLVGVFVVMSISNVEWAIDEADRVLKPGGKMFVVGECVSKLFYRFEKWVYQFGGAMPC